MKKPTDRRRLPRTPAKQDETELRRWCIEQATRWPVVMQGTSGYASGGASGVAYQSVDVDLIGRATKILNWVKDK